MLLSLNSNATVDLGALQDWVQVFREKISPKFSHVIAYPVKSLGIIIPKVLMRVDSHASGS
jgi:hypothetical protein